MFDGAPVKPIADSKRSEPSEPPLQENPRSRADLCSTRRARVSRARHPRWRRCRLVLDRHSRRVRPAFAHAVSHRAEQRHPADGLRPRLIPGVMRTRSNTIYEIDGRRFSTLEEFSAEVGRIVIPGAEWGRNLDAFNDILRGGFGTPESGFTLRWLKHVVSKERLGYPETIRQLELRLSRCHPTNRPQVAQELERARAGQGPTVFDWLVEIIRNHGPGGEQANDRVELILA
jgi:Barstar (barnase inhibitor)